MRAIHPDAGDLTLNQLTVRHGNCQDLCSGGGFGAAGGATWLWTRSSRAHWAREGLTSGEKENLSWHSRTELTRSCLFVEAIRTDRVVYRSPPLSGRSPWKKQDSGQTELAG